MKTRRLFSGLCVSVLCFAAASPALALANRVFVSARSGNDLNSCDNILTPCQTFAGAVVQLNPGGEAIVLDSGGYGPVLITQSLTIEAPPGVLAFIHPPNPFSNGIMILAGAGDTVILRGITLNGGTNALYGIFGFTVGQLVIEHCTISGFFNGVQFQAPGGKLLMRDDDVQNCLGLGVLVTSSGAAALSTIRDSYFAYDGNGGVEAGDGSIVTVTNCVAVGSPNFGFRAATSSGATADLTLDHVQAISNGTGAEAMGWTPSGGTAMLRFANSDITQNTVGIIVWGGAVVVGSSPGTSVVAGNVTDMYNGGGTFGSAITLR